MSGHQHLGVEVIAWEATADNVTKLYIGCDDPRLPDEWWESGGCVALVERLTVGGRYTIGEPAPSSYVQSDNSGDPLAHLFPRVYPYVWEVGRGVEAVAGVKE